jgi:nitrile hydratase|tara:strand:- start:6101 stop:7066 length:966 start_codon:yes stop_codon:yes gene_type:complete
MGPHDIGGENANKINPKDQGMNYWEKFSNGLRIAVSAKKIIVLDELRLASESLGNEYFKMEYFERNSMAMISCVIKKKLISEKEIKDKIAIIKNNFDVPIIELPNKESIKHIHDNKENPHQKGDFVEDEYGEGPPEYFFKMMAIAQILSEKNIISMNDIQTKIDQFDNEFPSRGIKVVVKAWQDKNFREFLIENAKDAIASMGIKLETFADIICMPQSSSIHNMVVCTLCSCYPRTLLGMPPTWYKSRSYRSRVVHEPRSVLAEFGTILSPDVEIRVHDSNADMRYLILPMRPDGTEQWSEEKLTSIISRDHLVGVRIPKI